MSTIFNIIWILTGGWVTALGWVLNGLFWYITIVGIPLGRVSLKMAKLTLAPFGREVEYGGGAPSLVANIFWLVLGGLEMAAAYVFSGCVLCITVVGIPFGLQLFKMAKLSLLPFGAKVD